MSTSERDRVRSAAPRAASATPASHALIVLEGHFLRHHSTHQSPRERLETCIEVLTTSQLSSVVDLATVRAVARALEHEHPDTVLNMLGQAAAEHDVHVHASSPAGRHQSTTITTMRMPRLYSVITEYEPTQIIVEHFPSRLARIESLRTRAEQFMSSPSSFPTGIQDDERRLASLIATFLMPARVSLSEATWSDSKQQYTPVIGGISITH